MKYSQPTWKQFSVINQCSVSLNISLKDYQVILAFLGCNTIPCLHGGSCVDTGIGIKCTCPPQFTGARCEAERKYTPMFGVLYGGKTLCFNSLKDDIFIFYLFSSSTKE